MKLLVANYLVIEYCNQQRLWGIGHTLWQANLEALNFTIVIGKPAISMEDFTLIVSLQCNLIIKGVILIGW